MQECKLKEYCTTSWIFTFIFWLCWVFLQCCSGFSPVAASGVYSLIVVCGFLFGFSCCWTWTLGQEGYAASVVAAYPWGFPRGASCKESICQFRLGVRDVGSFPESGSSPGEGNGNPLQYSCLENPKDRGAWHPTAQRVAKSQTQLND